MWLGRERDGIVRAGAVPPLYIFEQKSPFSHAGGVGEEMKLSWAFVDCGESIFPQKNFLFKRDVWGR